MFAVECLGRRYAISVNVLKLAKLLVSIRLMLPIRWVIKGRLAAAGQMPGDFGATSGGAVLIKHLDLSSMNWLKRWRSNDGIGSPAVVERASDDVLT